MTPLVALYRSHIDACRKWADLMLDNAQRFEAIGLRYTRSALDKSFSAAAGAATTDPSAQAKLLQPDGKVLEDMVAVQRELAAGMAEASQQMSRLMSEYTGTIARSMGAGVPMQAPQGMDAMLNFWSSASRQMTDMMQNFTQAGAQMARGVPPQQD